MPYCIRRHSSHSPGHGARLTYPSNGFLQVLGKCGLFGFKALNAQGRGLRIFLKRLDVILEYSSRLVIGGNECRCHTPCSRAGLGGVQCQG